MATICLTTIRLANEGDLSPLMTLVKGAVAHMNALGNPQWGEGYPNREHYQEGLDAGHLYVAVDGEGALLGAAVFNTEEDETYQAISWSVPAPAMVVHKMVVSPSAQRQGVASAFFDHCEGMAKAAGIASVRLDTYTKNDRMQNLLLQRGYTHVGHVHFPQNPLPYPCFEKVVSIQDNKI